MYIHRSCQRRNWEGARKQLPPLEGQGGTSPPSNSGNFLLRTNPPQSKHQFKEIFIAKKIFLL